MRIILGTTYAIETFYAETRKMEHLDYSINNVVTDIINDLQILGAIETAVDARFHSIVNSVERPNNDGYIMANAVRRLSKELYDELRQLDLWDSNGFLCVEFDHLLGYDIVLRFTCQVDVPLTDFYLDKPKLPKFTFDEWQAPLYWDHQNENNT